MQGSPLILDLFVSSGLRPDERTLALLHHRVTPASTMTSNAEHNMSAATA
jgi:hypothetical protein